MSNYRKSRIKNEEFYFNKILKNMKIEYYKKQSIIEKYEISVEEMDPNLKIEGDIIDQIAEQSLTGWIELIENGALHKIIKDLPLKDQEFISYLYSEGRTNKELAEIKKVSEAMISKILHKIISKIKTELAKK